jgi:proteasome activator subunit 4
MKGALYLLTHKSILMACLRDWRYIPDFILSICNAQHEDKLSIQELIRKIFLDYLSYFNQCSFRVVIAERNVTEFDDDIKVLQLSPSSLSATDDRSSTTTDEQQHINKLSQAVLDRNNEQKKTHEKLTESILALLANPRIHWRFSTMASNFLELLLRSEVAPTAGLASYFANTCTTSELPAMRRIGISAITQILLHIKQRTLAAGNEDLLITRSTHHPLKQSRPVASLFNHTDSFDNKGYTSLGEQLLDESLCQISRSR